MKYIPVDYKEVNGLSKRDLAFIAQDERLTNFIKAWPSIEEFKPIIEAKKSQQINRQLVVSELQKQYEKQILSTKTTANIESLASENTFTVVTAHQPSLFTGPLYYIYKIASTINLSAQLAEAYPSYHFVPVFVTGGEDHDFEEINKVNIYQKQIIWENEEQGPVGRMSTDGIESALQTLLEILGDRAPHIEKLKTILTSAVNQSSNYSAINFYIINTLFSEYGLVYLNMDSAAFKQEFIPIMKDELLHHSTHQLVNTTMDAIEAKGLKPQARPREINLFYFKKGIRERIVKEGDVYKVLNTDMEFSQEEMMQLLTDSPELFSPNVLLRPLYQETILPNLAYIGGGGEIAYWTERKAQFEHYHLPFPLLIRRNSALMASAGIQKQLGKTPFALSSFLSSEQDLTNRFIADHVSDDFSLADSKDAIEKLYEGLAEKAGDIDKSLVSVVKAEAAKQIKSLSHIEAKLKKAIKGKNDVQLGRISSIRSKLFPSNKLQERHENFAQYYAAHGDEWIAFLVENLNPLDAKFSIVELI